MSCNSERASTLVFLCNAALSKLSSLCHVVPHNLSARELYLTVEDGNGALRQLSPSEQEGFARQLSFWATSQKLALKTEELSPDVEQRYLPNSRFTPFITEFFPRVDFYVASFDEYSEIVTAKLVSSLQLANFKISFISGSEISLFFGPSLNRVSSLPALGEVLPLYRQMWNREQRKLSQASPLLGENYTVSTVNKEFSGAQHAQSVILGYEQSENAEIRALADQISDQKSIKAIFVAGPSGSNKTSFAEKLAHCLTKVHRQAYVISLDNYYYEDENVPLTPEGNLDYETIGSIDVPLLEKNIKELTSPPYQTDLSHYNFVSKKRDYRFFEIAPTDLLIFEGIHALNAQVTQALAKDKRYSIYICPFIAPLLTPSCRILSREVRLARRLVRDALFRSAPARETLHMWDDVEKGTSENIVPWSPVADYFFNSSRPYEMSLLRPFVEEVLVKVHFHDEEFPFARSFRNLVRFFDPVPQLIESLPKSSLMREFIGGLDFSQL